MKRKTNDSGHPRCLALLAELDGRLAADDETTGDENRPMIEVLRAQLQVMELKRLYRQGWLKRGIEPGHSESVADHSFGTAMLALLLAGRKPFEHLDRDRAMRIALVHELGEVYAGDITPVDGVSAEDKHERERASLERVLGALDGADELTALWQEFEDGSSAEARFVRELDRLEMGLQAAAYASEGSVRMEEFFDSARRAVQDPALRTILESAMPASNQKKTADIQHE